VSTTATAESSGILKQPKAVWAVAFACVVAFMGIGLVDPILPAIARQLHAGPSQVSLLFTSYFAVTGVAMLVTGWVSSRIGARRTLLGGLALVVIFSALAGASGSVGEIVGFRAGWGLGNALFIATALAVIVGSASGGVSGAIILYEAALGLGIASGPLLGGLLGDITWRGPFFGTAVLMAVGFVAIHTLLRGEPGGAGGLPPAPKRQPLSAPLRALAHPGLRVAALVALFYNFGFFTLLAYTPFPLGMGAHALGGIFFGWGLMLALSSVFAAPRIEHRFGLVPTLAGALALVAVDLAVMGAGVHDKAVLVACVVVAGAFLGVVNTVVTEAVMKVAPVERPIASAAYSFVRFTGGAIAPYLAGRLAEDIGAAVPFYVGAGAVAVSIGVLALGRRHLNAADKRAAAAEPEKTLAGVPAPAPAPRILVAVDGSPSAPAVTAAAARVAARRKLPVEVLHVRETDVVPEGDAVDRESEDAAAGVLAEHLTRLTAAGIEATGEVLHVVGDHESVTRTLLDRAASSRAQVVVVGAPNGHHGPLGRSFAHAAVDEAPGDVLVVRAS
jgi:MFS transporter, ACDE family, multidrug resistance protein